MNSLIWDREDLAKELGTKEEFIKALEQETAEEHYSKPSAGDENWVTCMRCGAREIGEERSVGDESYYLCDICNDDMNG